MPWPHQIHTRFARIPPDASEEAYHGSYNKLLNYLFPIDTSFTVVPQTWEVSGREIDYVEVHALEVMFLNKPVFILELKCPAELKYPSTRRDADDQIRQRMGELKAECPLPTLHAASAMGTKLCFYRVPSGNTPAQILPPANIKHNPVSVDDTAPTYRWDCDILEEEGEARFRAVVDEIRVALGQ